MELAATITLNPLIKSPTSPSLQNSSTVPSSPSNNQIENSVLHPKLRTRWMEYMGIQDWEGLLDPLDNHLRKEILRYGQFIDAAYKSFDFDPSSPSYATSRFSKNTILNNYRITKNLRVTSSISFPKWLDKVPKWVSMNSSWIGYIAVCHDKDEISRLGRRDIVIALRGTATCLEWMENLRASLKPLPETMDSERGSMAQSGFLNLYTSKTNTCPSLRDMIRLEIKKLLETYPEDPISLTFTGHSLGAALATLAAYDIKPVLAKHHLVTVFSFGGPRVGNRSFRRRLEKVGTKVLRIVNSKDVITKLPWLAVEDFPVIDFEWCYAEVGRELKLPGEDEWCLYGLDVATCHDLKTYLRLVNGLVSSTCRFGSCHCNYKIDAELEVQDC